MKNCPSPREKESNMKTLTTGRLILREFRESDYDDLFEFLFQLKDDEFEGYPGITCENGRKHLEYRLNSDEYWAIELKSAGKVIGNVYCGKRNDQTREAGFIINRDYQKEGYGLEALITVMADAFARGTRVIFALCDDGNETSWRLLEKAGMRRCDDVPYESEPDSHGIYHRQGSTRRYEITESEIRTGNRLSTYKPECRDLWFRQQMMADEETMSYNRRWGGTIPFPEEYWQSWHDTWATDDQEHYYRYVIDENGTFLGEIACHLDEGINGYAADVIIHARYRGRGHGYRALELLCEAAKEKGIMVLYDNIAIDNPAIGMFISQGFYEESRTDEVIWLRKDL